MLFSIIVWDIETFAPETIYESAHIHHVTSVRFIGCDNRGDTENSHHVFASTSLDGYCLLWDKRQQFPAKGKADFSYCRFLGNLHQH